MSFWLLLNLMLKQLTLLLFLLSSGNLVIHSFSQDTLFYSSAPKQYNLSYVSDGSPLYKNRNEIIREIADDAVKSPRQIHINLDYQLNQWITWDHEGHPRLSIQIKEPHLSGNMHYRGFPLPWNLMPDRIFISILMGNPSDSSGFKFLEGRNISWSGNDSILPVLNLPGFRKDTDSVILHQIIFYYDEDALNAFHEKLQLINDYYASAAVLDTLLAFSGSMDMRNPDRFPLYFIRLEEINKIVELIREKDFLRVLLLDQNDPKSLLKKHTELSRFSKSATMTIGEFLAGQDSLDHRIPEDSLVGEFISGMLRYIRWALLVNERNGRIYDEYLVNYFRKRAFGDDIILLKKLLVKMYPGKNEDSLAKDLSIRLRLAFRLKAEELIARNQYAEAFKILENARYFEEANPWLDKDYTNTDILSSAANGIFASYLGIAETAVRQRKFRMAENYLDKARSYQNANPAYVTSDSLYKTVLTELFDMRLEECDAMASKGAYEDAIDCYHAFEKSFADMPENLVNDAVKYRIDRSQLELWKDSLWRRSYTKNLISTLRAAESKIWLNQFDEASHFADSLSGIQKTGGFSDDTGLTDALEGYRRKIDERICWNTNESIEILMIRAVRNIDMKNFLKAGILLDSVPIIARENPGCHLPLNNARDTLSKYAPAIRYQQKLKEINSLYYASQYDQLIQMYMENLEDWDRENLSGFGLDKQSLNDFSRKKSNPFLIFHISDFFYRHKNYPESLEYLKLLRLQDFPPKKAKNLMKDLAGALAEADFPKYYNEDAAIFVKKYSGGDKWFSRFEFYYQFRWNELKNSAPAVKL